MTTCIQGAQILVLYYRFILVSIAAIVAVVCSIVFVPDYAEAGKKTTSVKIGFAKTFLVDQPKSIADVATEDFMDVLKKTTALEGNLDSKLGAIEIADHLMSKKFDFGIFHGHEFAWAKKKHPELQPLLIALNKQTAERAFVIVHVNNPAKTFADIRGKKIDIAQGTKEPCRVFLDMLCRGAQAKNTTAFFGAIERSNSIITALDAVAREKVQAAVIDSVNLAHYKDVRGPVFEKNLRVLAQSGIFPPAAVAYLPGKVDDAIVKQFRDGLLSAHKVAAGREMMQHWRIDAFDLVPSDYAKGLESVLKDHPVSPAP